MKHEDVRNAKNSIMQNNHLRKLLVSELYFCTVQYLLLLLTDTTATCDQSLNVTSVDYCTIIWNFRMFSLVDQILDLAPITYIPHLALNSIRVKSVSLKASNDTLV